MAFIDKRFGRKGIYAYYHDRTTGKLKQIPRSLTRHLDDKPFSEAQAWIEAWNKDHGMVRDKSNRMHLKETDKLLGLWVHYQSHRDKIHHRRIVTSKGESNIFELHILPFFVGLHHNKKPETWHDLVPEFHTHLSAKKLSDSTIRKTLWTLERFGKHLVFNRMMSFPFAVQIPANKKQKITPLKVRLEPDDVLDFVKNKAPNLISKASKTGGRKSQVTVSQMKLMVLLSYFGALGPSELFALEKSDFITGTFAEKFTKTLAGFRAFKFGSRLSVSITKTLGKHASAAPEELLKNDYRKAVVNIWNYKAALIIADILSEIPDGRLFTLGYSGLLNFWSKNIEPHLGTTIHDSRRASCLWLGRTKRINITLLQEHMRHSDIETTMLYMREPVTPEKSIKMKQDFNDV